MPTGAAEPRRFGPDSRFEESWLRALRSLGREIIDYRSHILTLFMNEFEGSYRGAAFGVAWNFILPILPISVYILLVSMRVFPAYEGIPPASYIAFNVTLWFLFSGFVSRPIEIVRGRNAEVMKTAMPLSATIAASFARLSFDTVVRSAFVAAVILAFGASVKITAVLSVGVILSAAVFCFGLGLLLAILNAALPDIERVVSIILTYGIFLSGVIFPLSSLGPIAKFENLNPFAVFITAARDLIFHGAISAPEAFAGWSVFGVALFVFAARVFYLMEYRIRGLS